jgi:pimeloyl-ACP methyl ester carboxylesterase
LPAGLPGQLPPNVPAPNPNGRFLPTGIYFETFGNPTQPALLLLHGYGMGVEALTNLVGHLAPDHYVVVPEHRGHGRSQAAAPAESIAQMASDALDVLDALGIQHFSVAGYSMGGAIAQEVARQAPGRVQKLVLGATFACKYQKWWERVGAWLALPALWLIGVRGLVFFMHPWFSGGKGVDRPTLRMMRRVMGYQTKYALMAVLKAIFRFDSRPWLHTLRCPVLLLHGLRDSLIQPWHTRVLARFIPNSSRITHPQGGHPLIYTHTTWMASQIRAFLSNTQ